MLIEKRDWCNGTNDAHYMKLDEACLHLYSLTTNATLLMQSLECDGCPLQQVMNVTVEAREALVVDTTYPVNLTLHTLSVPICSLVYHFVEYGQYNLNFTEQHCTDVYISKKPADPFLPILWAFLILVLGAVIYNIGNCLYRRYNYSVFPTFTFTAALTNELRVPNEGLPLIHAEAQEPSNRTKHRIRSLDSFRGLCIVLMIFVNYGGGKYWFFKHSRWNGLTVADLVFPWFMWVMGMSITLALRSQLRKSVPRLTLFLRVLKRSMILVALGIILNSSKARNHIAGNNLPTLRIPGVLQRFGLAYLVVAIFEVFFMHPEDSFRHVWWAPVRVIVTSWVQWIFMLLLIAAHIAVTFKLKVPGCPEGYLGPGGLHDSGKYFNCTGGAARFIDITVFGREHIYQTPTCKVIYHNTEPYDPEGLLGLLTSIFIVFLGVHAGKVLTSYKEWPSRILHWLLWGVVSGFIAGGLCSFSKNDGVIPVNKNLWSLSFILALASLAFFLLSVFYFVIDVKQWWSGIPLYFAGMNSILLYIGHEMTGSMFPWNWKPVTETHLAHLFMNLWGMSLWIFISYLLYRKRIFISI